MLPEVDKLLRDVLDAVDAAEAFAEERDLYDLGEDHMLRSALSWQLMVVGEALSQIRMLDERTLE